ncbi:Serine/threonine protein kinase [Fusarium sp. Ph1]|nr:Serine/threonine protein kinase [Fusarium sp. Ph1]
MATKSPPVDPGSGHSSQYTSSNDSRYSSGSQPHDTLGSIKDSRRSVASTKPFVDYNSLIEYATAANIEIIAWSKLQITDTILGAGVNMTVSRGSCVERFGDLSLAIKKYNVPILRGSSDLPQFTDEWMDQLAVMSLELRVLSDHLLRSHPNIVRLLGISFEICDPSKNAKDNQNSKDNKSSEDSKSLEDKFFKPILILEEAHRDYPTLERFYAHSKAQGHEIPTDVKVALWTGIADALSAVHIVGVVHGDIKPDNILLFENPSNGRLTAKLSDFGGCQPPDDSDAYDRYQLLGTEYWNALEAYDCGHPHHRSIYRDIYSFGLLGFYILFGSHPFGNPEERTSREIEGFYNFKSNWRGLSYLVVTILGRRWPQAMTKEAHKHLKSLPQATDIDSFRTRLASYRYYMENGDVQIGMRTKPSRPDALFGIRISEHPDYRPFAMALVVTLFIHAEPEKRDQWEILGNLSVFLNDKGTAKNLRDIYGSECWQYVLELLDTDKFLPWQLSDIDKSPLQGRRARITWLTEVPASINVLGWAQLSSVPASLRSILKGE